MQWIAFLLCLAASTSLLHAETLIVPNGSFESPATTFLDNRIDGWEKAPRPIWYDESGGFYWDQLSGVFRNTDPGSPDHIDNCAQNQGLYLFAVPEAGIFQDYESKDWSTNGPLRAFNAQYEIGKSYALTMGVIGGAGNMAEGATLDVSLYYRNLSGNMIGIASKPIRNSKTVFPNTTHLVDFQVDVPIVKNTDPWAGRHIGVRVLSTADPELAGGYWDLDNVRLTSLIGPSLTLQIVKEGGNARLQWLSAVGYRYQLQVSSNLQTWSDYGGPVTGTGLPTSTTIPFSSFSRAFFRVVSTPQP
ncbi:MAG: hypothetical protein JWM16_4451 [Verrucomicrobiales bacterium]|nr:hypothetical protein [Verrucomicrobiales bacterium]